MDKLCTPGFFLTTETEDNPSSLSKPAPDRSLVNNLELIQDLARYGEGLFTRAQVKKKWRELIPNEMWDVLGDDDKLVDAIEAEKIRRVRDGSFKRERAQQHITKAPDVLDNIMMDTRVSPKHRVDAVKTLDSLTANPAEAEQQGMFVIRIDLGADIRAQGGTPGPGDVIEFEAPIPRPTTIDGTLTSEQLSTPRHDPELPPPRRGRGRPPGSKNKPKVTDDNDGE